VHTYADSGLVAMDVFTCGSTNPWDVWLYVRSELELEDARYREVRRFEARTAVRL
jgi:S-adenosylmethionine decarboxylase